MSKIDCEKTDRAQLVEKYLLGGINRGEQKEMEAHLETCPKCSSVLTAQRKILSRLKKASRKAGWRREQVDALSDLYKPRSIFRDVNWKMVLIIAGVLFAITILPLIWKSQNPTFQMRQLAELELERSLDPGVTDSSGDFQKILELHQSGRHGEALLSLKQNVNASSSLENSVFTDRLLGLTFLHLEQSDSAMLFLHQALGTPDPGLEQRILWYIAQGHLLAGNKQGAMSALRQVSQLQGEFKTLSQELLSRLNKLR